jgi:hypothetical protein
VIERPGATSRRFTARMAGLYHLLMMLAEGMAAFARRGLVVAGGRGCDRLESIPGDSIAPPGGMLYNLEKARR